MKRERLEERLVSTLGEAGQAPGAGLRELKRLNSGKGVMGTVTYTSAAKLVLDSWSKRHSAPRLLFHASQVVLPLFICVSVRWCLALSTHVPAFAGPGRGYWTAADAIHARAMPEPHHSGVPEGGSRGFVGVECDAC
jgi:hypothetical protein